MKARLPVVAPIALSCEAQVAAGVSKSARLPKVASQGRRGLSVLRRPAHGRINPNTIEVRSAFKRFSRSSEKQAPSRLRCSGPESLVSSRVIYPQVQFQRQLGIWRIQRWYASPSKTKARFRLHERGLTLPSSGPAYGRPLKSNVRPAMKSQTIALVRLYQRLAPSQLRRACRYEPTCSHYMILAIEKYGVLSGLRRGLHRIIRCRPPYGGQDEP